VRCVFLRKSTAKRIAQARPNKGKDQAKNLRKATDPTRSTFTQQGQALNEER